jgi:Coenzyme PQQ synthesis protein D (PqqD)
MNLNTTLKPQAKLDNLVVQELSDEILIYNLQNNKAYSLNETTTLVWQNCDGIKDVSQIAQTLEKKLNQPIPYELVWLALDSLKKEKLVDYEEVNPSGLNRREIIKRVGLATMVALPILASVVAPTAAYAQSGVPPMACFECTKKDPAECVACGTLLGSCFNNAGCGAGSLLQTNITCSDCINNFSTPGGESWVAN